VSDLYPEGPEYWDAASGRRSRSWPRLLPPGVRVLRSQPDARVRPTPACRRTARWSYGKAYEEAEDALRPRRLRAAARDGHQLESGPRLPDARQHAVLADLSHRARLRAQRLLQEQLHVPLDARGVHAQHLQIARRAGQVLRRGSEHRLREGRGTPRRGTRCRSSAGATWRW
jgi:hypothetical protein